MSVQHDESLPVEQPPARRLPARLVLLLLVAAIGLVSCPAEQYGGDPWAWIMEASNLVNRATLTIDDRIARDFGDPGLWLFYNEKDDRRVSKYGFGSTLLLYVPYQIQNWLAGRPVSHFGRLPATNAAHWLLGLVLAWVLFETARLFTRAPGAALAWVLIVIYSSFVWNYMRAHSSELYQLLFFSATLYCLLRAARARWCAGWLCGASALLGFLCLVKLVYLPLVAVNALVVFALTAWDRREAGAATRRMLLAAARAVVWTLLPALFAGGALMAINAHKFGHPLETGYSQWASEQQAFSGNPLEALYGFLVNPRHSVWFHFWPLVPALFYFRRFARKYAREAILILANFAVMLAILCSYKLWHGECCYGPRYLLFGLPSLALPLLLLLEAFRRGSPRLVRWAFGSITALAVACQIVVAYFPFFYYYRIRDNVLGYLGETSQQPYLDAAPFPLIYAEFLGWRVTGRLPTVLESAERNIGQSARYARARGVLWNTLRANIWWLRSGRGSRRAALIEQYMDRAQLIDRSSADADPPARHAILPRRTFPPEDGEDGPV
ncbi:MAG: hypothetical protein JSV80_01250 [Acidobacteriota bacterium]|nr:MAG: hypothetical protein JSV80_01250 [Acidobacteriota bacterium]